MLQQILQQIQIDGKAALYVFEPDNYALELFVRNNKYVWVWRDK